MSADNIIIMGIITSIILVTLYYLFKKEYNQEGLYPEELFSIEHLKAGIKEEINELSDTSHIDLNLSKSAAQKEEARKLQLIKAVRNCGFGDINAKEFVKDYIKNILQKVLNINEETINHVIGFDDVNSLTVIDKFDILLYKNKKQHGLDAFYYLIVDNGFDSVKGDGRRDNEYHYRISSEDIEELYMKSDTSLDYLDKLEIVVQRIYSLYLGNGVIDEIRDMKKLDGISAGLSGLPTRHYNYLEEYIISNRESMDYYYNSIWCMFQGKTIGLGFLGFGSEAEMIRVAKKIYRYDDPGYLSENKGYIINSMSDGSRIVVVRPKLGENWAFFIRKLNSIEDISIENLLTDEDAEIPIKVMNWLVKGCCTIAVTGKQFSGKTTLLKSLVEFINPQYNIRVQEMIFELHLKEIERYRNRNIMTLRETPSISGQLVLDLFKKMDGDIYIFGEVHSPEACSLVVQGALAGTRQLMFSHHAKTSHTLIDSFKVALLQTGAFTSEMAAEEQVARAINFDFHMNTTIGGHIYLEKITEILPDKGRPYPEDLEDCFREFFTRITNEKRYKTKDIVVFKDGRYQLVGKPSDFTVDKLADYLDESELDKFKDYFANVKEGVN